MVYFLHFCSVVYVAELFVPVGLVARDRLCPCRGCHGTVVLMELLRRRMSHRPGCGRFGALMLPAIIFLVAGVGAASPTPSLVDSTQGMRMQPKWAHNWIKEGVTKDSTSSMGSCTGVGQAYPGYLNGLQARYRVAMRTC